MPALIMVIALFAASAIASGEDSSGPALLRQRAVLGAGQVVQGDYVAFGPRVVISGTVNGDVYAAGGRVLVDGVINGDLIVAGAKVILSGKVSQDARIAAAHAVLSGSIGRNVTVGAADIQMTDAGRIEGNMVAAGGDMELEGQIGRDARIGAGQVTVSNNIGGDLAVAAGTVRLTSKAAVGGRLRYWSETAPSMDEGATIRGTVTHRPLPEWWQAEGFRRGFAGLRVMMEIISLVSTLILGLVLLRLYPAFTRRAASMIRERPLRSLGWGMAALVGIPLAAVTLLVTLLGMPIGMILLAMYLVTLYLARIYAMTCLGQVLLRRTSDSSPLAWSFVAGLTVYALVSFIPVVGELVTLVTVLFGLGAWLVTQKEFVAAFRAQDQMEACGGIRNEN